MKTKRLKSFFRPLWLWYQIHIKKIQFLTVSDEIFITYNGRDFIKNVKKAGLKIEPKNVHFFEDKFKNAFWYCPYGKGMIKASLGEGLIKYSSPTETERIREYRHLIEKFSESYGLYVSCRIIGLNLTPINIVVIEHAERIDLIDRIVKKLDDNTSFEDALKEANEWLPKVENLYQNKES